MKILLVEDNPDLLECTRIGLEYLGYEVKIAKDGAEAVRLTALEQPDLIVLDMIMPKMDGRQAAARIRQNPKTEGIPILAAAGMCSPQEKRKALASGCDGYIPKPFGLAELGNAIKALIEKRTRQSGVELPIIVTREAIHLANPSHSPLQSSPMI